GIDYLERAYDDAKYGWYSRKPFVTPVVPTIVDDSLAPAGKHVINIFGGHAPYKLRDGASWADEKRNLTKAVLDVIDEMAPGFSGQVIEAETLVAPDLEAIVGLPQGHIFHGELSADQLFWQRPAPHWADYRTPITGLYQCGSSTHPGGGVSGIPGHNATRENVDIGLIGVPTDLGVTNRPGARHGPREIRNSSSLMRGFNLGLGVNPYELCRIADLGDVRLSHRYDLEKQVEEIEAFYRKVKAAGILPVSAGGDHSITYPIFRAIASPSAPVGMVHIDAHTDTWGEFFGSKFTHG